MPHALFEELAEVFPPQRLLTQPGALAAFESDGLTAYAQRPQAVVIPESEAEAIAAVRACHRHRVPFVARGSGTSLSGGSLPHRKGIVIALNRLNKIVRLDPEQRIAVVQPGVMNLAVSRAAAAHGLYYAPDPSSQQVCTIGGNLAFNSGGAHCLKYGMTSNHVLAVRAVLPDGEVVQLGGGGLEFDGPDYCGLYCGSEGLFGIATEITLRLLPLPEAHFTLLAGYPDIESAGDAVGQIVAAGLLPAAMEIMDRLAMKAAQAAVAADYPPDAEAVLIVELDGSRETVSADEVRLRRLIDLSRASAVRIAETPEQRAAIWKGRKSAFSAVGRISPDFIVQDGVVPRAKLGFALRQIDQISRETGVPVANVFHAGDGNLHPLILFDGRQPGALEKAERVAARILRLCVEMGGSITGEHGVGMEKRDFLGEMFDSESIDLMQRIRTAIDPHHISNRGKMFPAGGGEPTTTVGLHPLEKAGIVERM